MSKSTKNKIQSEKDYYYEVGVLNLNNEIIEEYVTQLPIIRYGQQVSDKLMNLMKETHGNDIYVVWNKKTGDMPTDKNIIDLDIPEEPQLNYNR